MPDTGCSVGSKEQGINFILHHLIFLGLKIAKLTFETASPDMVTPGGTPEFPPKKGGQGGC